MDDRELRAELDELWRTVRRIVRELHGVESSADPDQREGGLIEDVSFIRDQIENGGVKAQLPTSLRVAIITTAGVVLAAAVTGTFAWLTG